MAKKTAPAEAGPRPTFARGVRVCVAALVVLALTTAGLTVAFSGWPHHFAWVLAAALLVLLTMSATMILRFQYRDQVMALDLFEAVLAPAVFALPGILVVALVGVAKGIAEAYRKNHPLKALFNVAQWMLAAGVASLTYTGLNHGSGLSGRNLGGLVIAMTAAAVVNTISIATVIRLADGRPLPRVFGSLAPTLLLGWGINTTFGLLFVTSYVHTPGAIALSIFPLLVLRWSHRSYAAVLADKARLAGMNRATRALAGPIDPRDALAGFLTEVRSCFDAVAVDLVLLDEHGRTVYRDDAQGSSTRAETGEVETLAAALTLHGRSRRVDARTESSGLASLLEVEGWRECMAAPLFAEGRVIGMLCAYDRSGPEGFEDGELSILDALAREAADAIAKSGLLRTIVEERHKLAEIVEQTSDGILTLAPDGTIMLWNPGLERICGYPAAEMLGTRMIDRLRARDENDTNIRIDRWAEGEELPRDLQVLTRDGQTVWLSCSCTAVRDPDDRPRLMIMVVRDVTKAHEVERLKDDFVATVSHELRTPLTPIMGFAATLVESGDLLSDADRKTAARSILSQAEHLERLVVNLLEVSRLERDDQILRDSIVDAASVAAKVAAEFRLAHPDRAIIFETEGDCRARGDELFIGQIVSNLVSNAIKYAPPEEPIEVRVAEYDGEIEVAVTDRGPGIPSSETERIFDRFQRLGNVMTRATGGTGLGLYIARQLTQAVGGTLSVDSMLGKGSTFRLRLKTPVRLVAVS